MAGIKNGQYVQEYIYDFSVDGGSTGEYNLTDKATYADLPTGSIIKSVAAKVVTALSSAGSATLIWGNSSDKDGYSGVDQDVENFTDNAIFNGWDNGAALLWDDSNDHPIFESVDGATTGDFIFSISTAALTAGKMVFLVDYFLPSVE